MPSNLVTLVILANKSSGISVNEVQFEKKTVSIHDGVDF